MSVFSSAFIGFITLSLFVQINNKYHRYTLEADYVDRSVRKLKKVKFEIFSRAPQLYFSIEVWSLNLVFEIKFLKYDSYFLNNQELKIFALVYVQYKLSDKPTHISPLYTSKVRCGSGISCPPLVRPRGPLVGNIIREFWAVNPAAKLRGLCRPTLQGDLVLQDFDNCNIVSQICWS